MCVPREDFLNISASLYELCFDVVGIEKKKTKAVTRKTNTSVLDNHRFVVYRSTLSPGSHGKHLSVSTRKLGSMSNFGLCCLLTILRSHDARQELSDSDAEEKGIDAGGSGRPPPAAATGGVKADGEGRPSKRAKKQADYDDWKLAVLQKALCGRPAPEGTEDQSEQTTTMGKLKQSKLSFGA